MFFFFLVYYSDWGTWPSAFTVATLFKILKKASSAEKLQRQKSQAQFVLNAFLLAKIKKTCHSSAGFSLDISAKYIFWQVEGLEIKFEFTLVIKLKVVHRSRSKSSCRDDLDDDVSPIESTPEPSRVRTMWPSVGGTPHYPILRVGPCLTQGHQNNCGRRARQEKRSIHFSLSLSLAQCVLFSLFFLFTFYLVDSTRSSKIFRLDIFYFDTTIHLKLSSPAIKWPDEELNDFDGSLFPSVVWRIEKKSLSSSTSSTEEIVQKIVCCINQETGHRNWKREKNMS